MRELTEDSEAERVCLCRESVRVRTGERRTGRVSTGIGTYMDTFTHSHAQREVVADTKASTGDTHTWLKPSLQFLKPLFTPY